MVLQSKNLLLSKDDFYPAKATVELYCCNLPCVPTIPPDCFHALSRCGVGNRAVEVRGGKRAVQEGEKFSFAKVTCEFTVCQISPALPLDLQTTK